MRKSLFIAALCALTTLGMVSCKPQTTVDDVKVEVTPNTLTLGVGESSEKLAVKVTPAGNNQTVIWSSSDEAVATVKSGIVTGVAVGTATITATVGNASGTCVVTVTNDAQLENYVIGGWAIFGTPDYIAGTERYVTFTDGDSAKCQLGYATLNVWDDNLTYVSGKGFSGTGILCSAKIPVWWIIEGYDDPPYVGNTKGFFIDTITTGKTYDPYVAERGELVDVNKYGEFFSQYAAYLSDSTVKLDYTLYSEALTGARLYILYADKGNGMSYYLGNMKYANLRNVTDPETGKTIRYDYKAIVEWFDFYSDDRWFGLKATFDKDDKLQSIVTPYDMRTVVKEYTNMEATDEETEEVVAGYVLGDMSHYHAEVPVIYESALQKTMNLYRK